MTNATTKFLGELDGLLTTSSQQTVREIWSVLTALRGPDADARELKDYTTVHIRRAALPRVAASLNLGLSSIAKFDTRKPFTLDYSVEHPAFSVMHFLSHVEEAAHTLGLAGEIISGDGIPQPFQY